MPDCEPHDRNTRRHAGKSRACLGRIPRAKLDLLAFRREGRPVNALDFEQTEEWSAGYGHRLTY